MIKRVLRRHWAEAQTLCLLPGQALRLSRKTRLKGAPVHSCPLHGSPNYWGCLVKMSQDLALLDIHEVFLLPPPSCCLLYSMYPLRESQGFPNPFLPQLILREGAHLHLTLEYHLRLPYLSEWNYQSVFSSDGTWKAMSWKTGTWD